MDDLNEIAMRKTIYILALSMIQMGAFAQVLSLDSCKSLALENNKKLKEAHYEVQAAEQVKKSAFTKHFPRIDAGAVAMKSNKSLLEIDIPEMNLPVYDGNPINLMTPTEFAYFPGMSMDMLDYTNAASITAILPIFAGGRIFYGNQLAELGIEVSDLNLLLTTDEVILNTEYYFWTIMSLKEKNKTLVSYREMLESLEKDANIAENAGLLHKSNGLKIQLELGKIKSKELKLNNGIEMLKMSLAQHIGIPYSENLDFDDQDIEMMTIASLSYAPEVSVLERSEYKMLSKAIDAEVLKKRMVRGEILPQLSMGVQGLYLDVLEKNNTYGLAFATLRIPISDWWGGAHEIKEHNIKIEMAQTRLEESTEMLMLQIEKAYKDLNESVQQIEVSQVSLSQATEHFKVMDDNYKAGLVNTSDLLEARALLQQAHDDLWDDKTNMKIKQAYYLQAIAQLK